MTGSFSLPAPAALRQITYSARLNYWTVERPVAMQIGGYLRAKSRPGRYHP